MGATQPSLFLPVFENDPNICPATTLKHYLIVTKDLIPSSTDRLFITHKRPFRQASSQSLSRWIRSMLKSSGLNVELFSAYSTRHAAVSKANRLNVPLDVIRNAAGWSTASETFARFYHRPVLHTPQDAFARAVFSV